MRPKSPAYLDVGPIFIIVAIVLGCTLDALDLLGLWSNKPDLGKVHHLQLFESRQLLVVVFQGICKLAKDMYKFYI